MTKQITQWRKKGRTAATVDFDSSTTDYDDPTTPYAGNGETPASVIKQRTSWGNRAKQLTRFVVNTLADANRAVFDADETYDAAVTYDGIVVGEPRSTAKKPTSWSRA